jgi:hypothetical protein
MKRLALVLLLACTKRTAEPGSCYHPLENSCTEYGPENALAAKRMCRPSDWRPGLQSCPTPTLGTCSRRGGKAFLYAGPPNNFTPESAKSACEFGQGTFARAEN